jgi:hypothetical protein
MVILICLYRANFANSANIWYTDTHSWIHLMPMHELNLNDEPTTAQSTPPAAAQPMVDDPMLASHNQPAGAGSTPVVPTKDKPMKKSSAKSLWLIVMVTVALGVGTGFLLNKTLPAVTLPGSSATPVAQVATGTLAAGDVFGATDASAFKDSASGYLQAGGLEGEGSHSLLREGGPSQTVYLTSSVTDLTKFEGMEIKVWGETFRGQKAGWLMDVGRIEVINPEGQQPE